MQYKTKTLTHNHLKIVVLNYNLVLQFGSQNRQYNFIYAVAKPPLTTNGNHRVLVSEEEIKRAMKLIAVTDRWMIEGGTGVDEISS